MFLKKLLAVFLFGAIAFIPAIGQDDDEFEDSELRNFKERKFDWSKVSIEPNLAIAYTSNYFLIGSAPYVGYEFAKDFYAGPGIIYYFSQIRNVDVINSAGIRVNRININENTIGGGVFAQYYFYKQAFVRTKFEYLNRKYFSGGFDQDAEPIYSKLNVPVLLVGAGYNLTLNRNFMFPIMVSYDVIHDPNSPYVVSDFPLYIQLGFVSYF